MGKPWSWRICFGCEEDYPVNWFKFIPSIPGHTPVHLAYSTLASMNHQWTVNLHDGYCPPYALMPIPPTLLLPCNLMFSMFHFGVDYLHPNKETQHDLPSLAPPQWEMASSLSWTSLFKSPTPRILCWGDPTLAKLDQVIPAPKDIFNKYLLTEPLSMHETGFSATKSMPFCDTGVHSGTTFLLKLKANITMPPETEEKCKTCHPQ